MTLLRISSIKYRNKMLDIPRCYHNKNYGYSAILAPNSGLLYNYMLAETDFSAPSKKKTVCRKWMIIMVPKLWDTFPSNVNHEHVMCHDHVTYTANCQHIQSTLTSHFQVYILFNTKHSTKFRLTYTQIIQRNFSY